MVSALACSARGHGFDPRGRRCPNMLSIVSFAGMTLNKCAVYRIGTLTGGPLCRESHPLGRVKNPTVVDMIICRLSSCKTGVYNVRLLITLERGCSSMYRKRKREKKRPSTPHTPGSIFHQLKFILNQCTLLVSVTSGKPEVHPMISFSKLFKKVNLQIFNSILV